MTYKKTLYENDRRNDAINILLLIKTFLIPYLKYEIRKS
jgi:hypothetical protein